MKTVRNLLVALILIVIFLISGCSNELSAAKKQLRENQEKWDRQSELFDRDYTYTIQIGCFCPEDIRAPVNVSVMDGETKFVVYQKNGQPVTNDIFNRINSVENLFKIVQEAIDSEADKLTVEYDVNLGYPKHISIDPIKDAVDEEHAYTISDFAILK